MGFLRDFFNSLIGRNSTSGSTPTREADTIPLDREQIQTGEGRHGQLVIQDDGGAMIEEITPLTPMDPVAVVPQTRQLPPTDAVIKEVSRLSYGHETDVGKERSNNQDSLLVMTSILDSRAKVDPFNLFVVADGMGGHIGGDIASAITTATLAQKIMTFAYLPTLDSMDPEEVVLPDVRSILVDAFHEAGERIKEAGIDGGTTCTAVVLQGNVMHLAHVGDSRAYLIRQGGIEKLTRDHSLTGRLVEIGQLTQAEVRTHPERSKLYKTLGMGNDQDPEVLTRHVEADSWLLLCSDGLWEPVHEDAMLEMLRVNPNPQRACEELVALANELGGDDNITVVLVRIPE